MVTYSQAVEAVRTILEFIGEDPARPGLVDTPDRFLKAWRNYWGKGYSEEVFNFKSFPSTYNEMVVVKDIKFYSHCEHHIAPIIGVCHIGYLPDKYVLGLSKFARIVEAKARKLVLQENLTEEIANTIQNYTNCLGVGVVIEAEHLCMSSRGVEKQNSKTTTSKLLGEFQNKEVKEEFLSLIGGAK